MSQGRAELRRRLIELGSRRRRFVNSGRGARFSVLGLRRRLSNWVARLGLRGWSIELGLRGWYVELGPRSRRATPAFCAVSKLAPVVPKDVAPRRCVPYPSDVGRLDDADIRRLVIVALCETRGLSPTEAEDAFDSWQGDHDYQAWQRGYVESLMFASNLLLDEADSVARRR